MPFPHRSTALLLAALTAGVAQAQAQAQIVFACTTTRGKPVQIEARGEALHYRYGPADAPELEFSQARSDTRVGACSSAGKRHDWLVMTNQGHDYMIMAEGGQRQHATLDVYVHGRKSSSLTLNCQADSIQNHLSQLHSAARPCGQ